MNVSCSTSFDGRRTSDVVGGMGCDSSERESRENVAHDCGQTNQHSTIEPEIRRQELQWSSVMIGRRSVTLFCSPKGRFGGSGIAGLDSSAGTEIVYVIALQKQPP